ncbi:hypothetical protein MUN88_02310 [Gracilibacillus caseinilyticus]|uniref:Uncharacterized protein n=1 Tax=Gracilibacillus caseinilyticus TaxID=2932256 RepID=A0ABY4EYR8_9BACI|nr:hypothetical protein [Gracilibacillus caseinilyticus]UOQ48992.1 hypothetical protein MUN88_02310 [Gracilibacillus caseinilyticus]
MKNTMIMETEASYSLNFLLYIQNIYLNRHRSMEDQRFPYLTLEVEFKADFEERFQLIWDKVLQRISKDPLIDLKIFRAEKDLFYQHLIMDYSVFLDIYSSFKVWWNSFAGRFAIERATDETGQSLYTALANSLVEKRITSQKRLRVSLLYDECILVKNQYSAYFAVIPIEHFHTKFEELVTQVEQTIS